MPEHKKRKKYITITQSFYKIITAREFNTVWPRLYLPGASL